MPNSTWFLPYVLVKFPVKNVCRSSVIIEKIIKNNKIFDLFFDFILIKEAYTFAIPISSKHENAALYCPPIKNSREKIHTITMRFGKREPRLKADNATAE